MSAGRPSNRTKLQQPNIWKIPPQIAERKPRKSFVDGACLKKKTLKLKCFILLLSHILFSNCGFVFTWLYPAGFLCKSECKLNLHLGYFFLKGANRRQRTAVTDNFVGTSLLSTVSVARQSQVGIGIKRAAWRHKSTELDKFVMIATHCAHCSKSAHFGKMYQ